MPSYGTTDPDYASRLHGTPEAADGPFHMLSLAKYQAGHEPGPVSGSAASQDPDSQYFPVPLLSSIGASIRFVATVIAGSGDWDRAGIITYPSRRAFAALSSRGDALDWLARREPRFERLTMLGMLPASSLPPADPAVRVVLELWNGPEPEPLASGHVTRFEVEGTYVGDGRKWSGARYTPVAPGTPLPLLEVRFAYQALLLKPSVVRWP